MGFSYGPFGLCCDFCDRDSPSLNVRKIACPYGYCQAWACCIECKAKKLHLISSCTNENKTHKEICKQLAYEFNHKEEIKQSLINSGQFICVAAECIDGTDNVKVWFKGKNETKIYVMENSTYDKIQTPAIGTLDEYQKLGKLEMFV